VHDDVEDRVRSVLRAEGDGLPMTITPDALDRRLALRRRERQGRRLGLTAAAVAVVAMGSLAAAANGWLRLPGAGTAPDATGTASPADSPPPAPTPSTAGVPCTTIEPNPDDQPPTIVLGATPGDSLAYGGGLGAFRLGDRTSGDAGDWAAVDPTALTAVPAGTPTERLQVLAGNPDACLTGVVARLQPFGQVSGAGRVLADVTGAPTRVVEFDLPPPGEWLLLVHATFATSSGAEAWTETFFRILVGAPAGDPGPVPTALPSLEAAHGTSLLDAANAAAPPFDPTGQNEETIAGQVPPRGQYRVEVTCVGFAPLRWSIGHEGQLAFLAAGDQPCDGTVGSFEVAMGLPPVDLPVVVQADSGAAWHIRVSTIVDQAAFLPPALRMAETGNTEGAGGAVQAFGRCVSTPRGSDQCAGAWFVLDGARQILIPARSSLTFALDDGWTIDQARVTAAMTDQVRLKPMVPEYSVGFVDAGGPTITVPVELGRGSWIVRVALNASRDGLTFGAYYDLPLVIGD
jgi:hypothetical protein